MEATSPVLSPHCLIFQGNNSHESSLLSKSPMAMAMPLSHSFSFSQQALKSSLIGPNTSKRGFLFKAAPLLFLSSFALSCPSVHCLPGPSPSPPPKSPLPGIANTKSWLQYYGDGFSIRILPQFEDITEPEDFNAGTSLYGDKSKPKTFAARFSSSDGFEVLSVVIRSTNQLKITFLEAQDVSDLGSLKEAARIFVPGGSTIYTARTIKIKEDEGYRTYYFYEFGRDEQHVALVAAVNSGKAIIAGATAPESKWEDDGVRLRSAAISLTVL